MTERMFMLAPTVTFAARVNMASVTYPVTEITYDGVTTGIYSSIFDGSTLLLGTTAGADDLGRQRVRRADATTITVGRSSQGTHDGELTVQDNAYITILQDFRVWSKIPYIITGSSSKDDDIGPVGNTDAPFPIANGGPGFCGTIDSTTGVITVTFDATASRQFNDSSPWLGTVSSYSWEVDDGTITVGTSSSDTITATFPAGFRWVYLSVTDAASRIHQKRIPVYARDPDNDDSITNFEIINQRITPQGQEVSVRVLDDIPASTYPDGTLVMIWSDEPSGPTDRTHMQFIGWHQQDEGATVSLREGVTRDTVLHLVDVAGRLKTLPGFPQLLRADATATKWTETEHPHMFYFIWYILFWHSTALDVADLIPASTAMGFTSGIEDFEFVIKDCDADTIYNQAHTLAQAVTPDRHFNCTRRGQFVIVRDPMLMHTGDRSLLTEWTISRDEWTELRFTHQRPPRTYKLLAWAVENETVTQLAAMAPGLAEGQGANYIETSERIAGSQFQLNYTEGNRYARLNAPYGPVNVTIPITALPDDYEPALMQWVEIEMDAAEVAQRGHDFDGARGIVTEIQVQRTYARTGTTGMATVTWERETSGPEAETYTPPS